LTAKCVPGPAVLTTTPFRGQRGVGEII